MKGKSNMLMVSARIRAFSDALPTERSAYADSFRTGTMNSSLVTVSRKMQPNTPIVFLNTDIQFVSLVRGYSSS